MGASYAQTITNTATRFSSDQVDRNAANDTGRASFTVSALIDLAVDISVGSGPYYTNESYPYTVVVNNNGPSNATGVIDTVFLPAGLTAGNIVAPVGTSYITDSLAGQGVIYWTIGNLDSGATVTLTYDGTLHTSSATAVTYNTPTRVAGNEHESTYANNSDNVIISTTPSADVAVVKTRANQNESSVFYPGDTVVYTFVYTNAGPDPSTNHVVKDPLPSGVTYVAGSAQFVSGTGGATGSVSFSSNTATFTSQIPVGQSVTYTLKVRIND